MTTTGWRDAGLQPERTVLSWRRTTLTAAVVTLLLAKLVTRHAFWPSIGTLAAASIALAVISVGMYLRRRTHWLPGAQIRALPAGFMVLVPATVLVTAVFALISIVS